MKFQTSPFELFDKEWALLTAGREGAFNTMTIGWGGLGTLWRRSVATVYVKPIRYTHEFMEKNDYFTISFYPEQYRKALSLLGTLSGRDVDKVAQSGLTPVCLENGVTFAEASRTIVLKKIYRQEMDLSAVPADARARYYAAEPPHTMYIGEVVKILGK